MFSGFVNQDTQKGAAEGFVDIVLSYVGFVLFLLWMSAEFTPKKKKNMKTNEQCLAGQVWKPSSPFEPVSFSQLTLFSLLMLFFLLSSYISHTSKLALLNTKRSFKI